MGLAVLSHVIGNWWENTCISHMVKYTIKWDSNGKKALILWEKYEYQFSRFIPCDGFCCIFSYYEKLMRKHMYSPCDEVYHRMGSNGKKAPILWEEYEYWFPRLSSYDDIGWCFPVNVRWFIWQSDVLKKCDLIWF